MDDFTLRHLTAYAAENCNDNVVDAGFIGWVHALDEDDLGYYERHGWTLALRHYREAEVVKIMGDGVKHLYFKGPDRCDHCALPVERATLETSPGIVWWKIVGSIGGVHCRVRQGRHTVNGIPLGEHSDNLSESL